MTGKMMSRDLQAGKIPLMAVSKGFGLRWCPPLQNIGEHGLKLCRHGRGGVIEPVDIGFVQPHGNVPVLHVVGQTQHVVDVTVGQQNSDGSQAVLLQSSGKSIRVAVSGVDEHAVAAAVRSHRVAVDAQKRGF